jgi:hypothetical protein
MRPVALVDAALSRGLTPDTFERETREQLQQLFLDRDHIYANLLGQGKHSQPSLDKFFPGAHGASPCAPVKPARCSE